MDVTVHKPGCVGARRASRIQALLLRSCLSSLVCLGLAAPVMAQLPAASSDAVSAQLQQIDKDLAAARALDRELGEREGLQAEILSYRLDQRVLRLLRRADEVATAVSSLPKDDPQVVQLRDWLVNDFDRINQRIFDRLAELGRLVGEKTNALDELSGADRVIASAEVDLLDGLLEQYLRGLVRHMAVRETLGLGNEALRPRLQHLLTMRAETVSGFIVLASSMLRDFRSRSAGQGNKADIDFLVDYTQDRRSHFLRSLEGVVAMMQSIGMDPSEYQSLLVSQQGVSFNVFNRSVIAELAENWKEAMLSFAGERGPDIVFKLFLFVVIIVVFRFLARLVQRLLRTGLGRSRADLSVLLKDTLVSVTGGLVFLAGLLIALSQIGLSVGPMLAGLGIAGFIIGFALQDTLANFASGAMILIYRPFDVDDYVEVTGATGVVKKMNLVSTTINTFDNQTLVVPNSKIWGDVIKNVTQQKVRRVDLEFGIAYDDDIEKAERILAELAAEHDLVLEEPATNVRLHRLGDSAVVLILRPWVKTEDYWSVYWDLTRAVKLRFDAEGITIPFPQRTIHMAKAADTEVSN